MLSEPPTRKVVLLPGMDGTGALFDPFIASLPAPFEAHPFAYPLDQPLSYSELADYVRAQLRSSEPFVLLAESFSTPLAIQIAAAHPSDLKALILVAGFVTSPTYSRMPLLASFPRPARRRLRLPTFLVRRLLLGPGAPPSSVHAVKQAVSSLSPEVVATRVRSIFDCDVRAELAQITVPTLYLQANQDRIVPPRCLDDILIVKPETFVTKIDGPHLLLQREPRQSAEAVADFIRKLNEPDHECPRE
jgi:pimeloyl-[acyl-carrier protein] methyl ester esterase